MADRRSYQAAVYERFGPPDVLTLRQVQQRPLRRGELLIKVRAAALNPKDCLLRKGKMGFMNHPGWPKPTGHDFAGDVAEVGAGVSGYELAQPVFGMINGRRLGCCAQFVIAKSGELAAKPDSMSYQHAAAMPLAAQTALQALRDLAAVQPGQHVLINGASGGVGTFAVQIAKALGAKVTALCSSANKALVESLGADEWVDYAQQPLLDYPQAVDVIFDVFGNYQFDRCQALLSRQGSYISTVPKPVTVADHLRTRVQARLGGGQHAHLVVVKSKHKDLQQLAEWFEAGLLQAHIDTVLPLSQIAAGHAQIETKRTRGKIIIEPQWPDYSL